MPRKIKRTRGRGLKRAGGALLRAGERRRYGCGVRAVGGSMRHYAIPATVRNKKIEQLNSIIKSAAQGAPRASVSSRLKSWATSAHNLASKYGLYSKGAQVARLGYNLWQAKKGQPASIGYTPTPTITYVD